MPLLEENELPELNPAFGDDSEQKQRRQMLIALALLLLALILVLVKDREFWFPPSLLRNQNRSPSNRLRRIRRHNLQTATTATPSAPAHSPRQSTARTPPPAVATKSRSGLGAGRYEPGRASSTRSRSSGRR